MQFLGIAREAVFSPGKVDADAGILHAVGDCLRVAGHDVRVVAVDAALHLSPSATTVVFAMCQGDSALALLRRWDHAGARVINRPSAIHDSQRWRTIPLLRRAHIPFPETMICAATSTAADLVADSDFPLWIKRGDVHATQADDVVFAASRAVLLDIVINFEARGIERIALQRHVPGTVIKFYAVANGFFHCVQPVTPQPLERSTLDAIEQVGRRAAAAVGLEVYGGDCVVADDGAIALIDLNDWPSYGPCRAQAAAAIAAHILAQKETLCV